MACLLLRSPHQDASKSQEKLQDAKLRSGFKLKAESLEPLRNLASYNFSWGL